MFIGSLLTKNGRTIGTFGVTQFWGLDKTWSRGEQEYHIPRVLDVSCRRN